MDTIKLIKPEEKYIPSYWETFDSIAKERKYLAFNEAFPYDGTVAFIKESISNAYPHIFVIDTASDICVGWCDVMPKTETIGYLGMGLLPQYRENGVGQRMLTKIIELSKQYGFNSIELDVLKSNTRAIHVYERLGFHETNLVVGGFTWHNTLVSEDVVQMSLELR